MIGDICLIDPDFLKLEGPYDSSYLWVKILEHGPI